MWHRFDHYNLDTTTEINVNVSNGKTKHDNNEDIDNLSEDTETTVDVSEDDITVEKKVDDVDSAADKVDTTMSYIRQLVHDKNTINHVLNLSSDIGISPTLRKYLMDTTNISSLVEDKKDDKSFVSDLKEASTKIDFAISEYTSNFVEYISLLKCSILSLIKYQSFQADCLLKKISSTNIPDTVEYCDIFKDVKIYPDPQVLSNNLTKINQLLNSINTDDINTTILQITDKIMQDVCSLEAIKRDAKIAITEIPLYTEKNRIIDMLNVVVSISTNMDSYTKIFTSIMNNLKYMVSNDTDNDNTDTICCLKKFIHCIEKLSHVQCHLTAEVILAAKTYLAATR